MSADTTDGLAFTASGSFGGLDMSGSIRQVPAEMTDGHVVNEPEATGNTPSTEGGTRMGAGYDTITL